MKSRRFYQDRNKNGSLTIFLQLNNNEKEVHKDSQKDIVDNPDNHLTIDYCYFVSSTAVRQHTEI
jgi:hypothetical protein